VLLIASNQRARERKSTPQRASARACLGKHLHFSIPALSRASPLINTYLHEIVITESLEKCAPLSPLWPVRFFLWRGAEVKSDYGPRPAEKLCGPSQSTRKKTCQTTPNARRAAQQYELSSAIPLLAFHQTWETAARRRQFLPAR
jgi:hypothetical protein